MPKTGKGKVALVAAVALEVVQSSHAPDDQPTRYLKVGRRGLPNSPRTSPATVVAGAVCRGIWYPQYLR